MYTYIKKIYHSIALVDFFKNTTKRRLYILVFIIIKGTMKYRKTAIDLIAKNRGLSLPNARILEKKIFKYGKCIHPRLIRLILQNKDITIETAYKILSQDITIEQIKENEDEQYIVEGEISCRKCNSKKVMKQDLQTRGSDESTTTFYKCVNCKSRWKK